MTRLCRVAVIVLFCACGSSSGDSLPSIVDECAEGTHDCAAAGGVCTDTVDGFTCECGPGFEGDGKSCVCAFGFAGANCEDLDECNTPGVCGLAECVNTSGGFACYRTIGVDYDSDFGYWVDHLTYGCVTEDGDGNCSSLVTETIDDGTATIEGILSIAREPTSNVHYAIVKVSGVGRVLATINPVTLHATTVGDLGDKFGQLEFLPDGTLYGVTGDGAETPETLYTINKATAASTLVTALGNGGDGECIAYNTDDNKMYHFSGNGTSLMERFALTPPYTIEPISADLDFMDEVVSCDYMGNGLFRLASRNETVHFTDTAGTDQTAAQGGPFGETDDYVRSFVRADGFALVYTANPTSGLAAGGEAITLNGGALTDATSVTFNGAAATITDGDQDDFIVVTSPPGTAGAVTIEAVLASGLHVRWPADAFSYTTSLQAKPVAKKNKATPHAKKTAKKKTL